MTIATDVEYPSDHTWDYLIIHLSPPSSNIMTKRGYAHSLLGR